VNNAGMVSVSDGSVPENGSLGAMTLSTWRAGLARNLDTAFLVSREVVPVMADRGWGRIVNVTSVTGPVMAMRDEPVYAAAKAGMVGLTRSIAIDYGRAGITANAVAPGWIATGSQTAHEYEQGLLTPAGRSATADEVAAAVVWLCTPGAAYVTGQCLVVDGGNSVAEERAGR
jgi:3-oxoacyl-[acyl-carrier protein] reductase